MTDAGAAGVTSAGPLGEAHAHATGSDVIALDAAHVMGTYGRFPVEFVRGCGTELFDQEGGRYLDFLSGLAVTSLGHAHPAVAAAIAAQASKLLHVSNLFHTEHQAPLAAALDGLLGGGGRCFFANSGAEANECAIKLARRYGQLHGGLERYHVISAYGSFHGRTLATLAATGQPQKQETFQPLPSGFRQVGFADLDALEAALDDRACAVLLESVQGEGGVQPAPVDYLRGVRRLCDEREALLIVDEVQTGLARTGRWFGFEHSGVVPDIVTVAKALGNGMPIGACWARAEVAAAFKPGDHATTFGGQPLAASAARAVLTEMQAIDAPALARAAGARLTTALEALPAVTAVRGLGLLLAAELAPGYDAAEVARACLDSGVVVNAVTPSALRLAPPLIVSNEEIDEAVAIIGSVLHAAVLHEPDARQPEERP
jgi:acetylornithine/N-succinyldiaminopimelate aminotransferase